MFLAQLQTGFRKNKLGYLTETILFKEYSAIQIISTVTYTFYYILVYTALSKFINRAQSNFMFYLSRWENIF